MTFLRVVLSIFAILNVVFWALLAWVWAVKPSWAARIPLNLGTDERFKTSVPVWARLPPAPGPPLGGGRGPPLSARPAQPPPLVSPLLPAPLFLPPLLCAVPPRLLPPP